MSAGVVLVGGAPWVLAGTTLALIGRIGAQLRAGDFEEDYGCLTMMRMGLDGGNFGLALAGAAFEIARLVSVGEAYPALLVGLCLLSAAMELDEDMVGERG